MQEQTSNSSVFIKFLASALLLFSCALFILAKVFYNSHAIWPWIEAFSEAAMVGALADWFAVTALFRHPLGIPIPHTAIIPKSQGRIAKTLSRFVQENFLEPESLAPRLKSARLGQKLVEWLSDPVAAKTLAVQLKDLIRGILLTTNDKDVTDFIAKALPAVSEQIKLGPLSAEIISSVRESDKDAKLFNEILQFAKKLLQQHKEVIQGLVSQELPWYIPKFVKNHLYTQVVEAASRTIAAMQSDQNHTFRVQLTGLLDRAISELRQNQNWEDRLQEMVKNLCQKGSIVNYLGNLKTVIIERLNSDQQEVITNSIVAAISYAAQTISTNSEMSEKLNQFLEQIMLRVVRDYGGKAGGFIEDTMRSWDAGLLSSKIEAEVGKDLQFIRINGTLVGGLVGVFIHLVLVLIAQYKPSVIEF